MWGSVWGGNTLASVGMIVPSKKKYKTSIFFADFLPPSNERSSLKNNRPIVEESK
jgi:hypothetical protein